MKEYLLNNSRVAIYTLHEALVAAGSADSDDVFSQDTALESYFEGRRVERLLWNPNTYNTELTQLVKDGVDVVIIIKE